MAIVLLEGLDKTGKSTVAEYLRQKERYEYIHMTVPAKWHTRDTYFAEMLHTIALTAGKNVVIDRTWFGELVWPHIFGRKALLSSEDCEMLTLVASTLHSGKGGLTRIYMHDPNEEAHLARIREYKEPTYDFEKARELYNDVAHSHDFNFTIFQSGDVKEWI